MNVPVLFIAAISEQGSIKVLLQLFIVLKVFLCSEIRIVWVFLAHLSIQGIAVLGLPGCSLLLQLAHQLPLILLLVQCLLHFVRSEHLNTEQNRCSLFCLKHASLLRRNVQNTVVSKRVPHEGNVYTCWQVLVNQNQLLLQYLLLLFFRNISH